MAYHLSSVPPAKEEMATIKINRKGDIILLEDDENYGHRSWPLARVLEVHPGTDRLVRVVTVLCGGNKSKRTVKKLVPLRNAPNEVSPARECIQAY